ncbi:MAG: TetR/AcrR family transcriptional regulator [Ilumatobacteraceae bacterium]
MKDDPPARQALVSAAKAMLPERAPSSVSGRELATRAGVNYGLIHHYFGGKDAVFREAVLELRAEFLETHSEHHLPDLVEAGDPFLRAIGRSQVDYPNELGPGDDFPIGEAMVRDISVRIRAAHPDWSDRQIGVEAKARSVAMLAVQLGFGLYRDMLLDTVDAKTGERAEIEHALCCVYRNLARRPTS